MAPDPFDGNSPLTPEEQLDSDEIRNADGDEVVDTPDNWIEAKEDESLDERLAEEEPDVQLDDGSVQPPTPAHDDDAGGGLLLTSDEEIDRLDPNHHGRDAGQIDGTPEDGESFFDVEK